MNIRIAIRCAAALAALACSHGAHAQLFRAYLASDGNDANPCTLPQPCRLLPAALAAVASGGEIWMLDSANYNTTEVGITKSVTILAVPGALGSVVAAGGHAISVTTASVRVALRNLVIVPLPGAGGVDGINIGGGATSAKVRVENCLVARLPGKGIAMTVDAQLHVVDSIVRDNSYGIHLTKGSTAVSGTRIIGNTNTGFYLIPAAASTVTASVDDSSSSFNSYGFGASSGAGRIARLHVARSIATGNTYNGFQSYSDGAATDSILEVSGSASNENGGYGFAANGGTIRSAGDNRATGNAVAPTLGAIAATASY